MTHTARSCSALWVRAGTGRRQRLQPQPVAQPQAQHCSYRVPYFLLELPVRIWGHRPRILPCSHQTSLSASSTSQPTSTFSYVLWNNPYISNHTLSHGVGRITPAVRGWGFPSPPSELLVELVVCSEGDSHSSTHLECFHSEALQSAVVCCSNSSKTPPLKTRKILLSRSSQVRPFPSHITSPLVRPAACFA